MKNYILIFVISILTIQVKAQNLVPDIKGNWIVNGFRGSDGPNETEFLTDQMAKMSLGDTLVINDKIYYSDAFDEVCDYNVVKSEEISDINTFLYNNFRLRPIQLGLDKNKDKILILYNSCNKDVFNKVYFVTADRILLHDTGMFYILNKLK